MSKHVAELNIQTFVYVNFELLLLLILLVQMHLISDESTTWKLLWRHKCEIVKRMHFQVDNLKHGLKWKLQSYLCLDGIKPWHIKKIQLWRVVLHIVTLTNMVKSRFFECKAPSQIDHILIDRRWHWNMLHIKYFRECDFDSATSWWLETSSITYVSILHRH